MYYLDRELASYQEDRASQCDICFEYCDDSWTCSCCHECEKESCVCDEDDDIVTRQIDYQK
jgi:hypothetical protein